MVPAGVRQQAHDAGLPQGGGWPVDGAELRALRDRLGISQAQAARLFGGGPVAFSTYENDDLAQSEAMDRLIRLAADVPQALRWLTQVAIE